MPEEREKNYLSSIADIKQGHMEKEVNMKRQSSCYFLAVRQVRNNRSGKQIKVCELKIITIQDSTLT